MLTKKAVESTIATISRILLSDPFVDMLRSGYEGDYMSLNPVNKIISPLNPLSKMSGSFNGVIEPITGQIMQLLYSAIEILNALSRTTIFDRDGFKKSIIKVLTDTQMKLQQKQIGIPSLENHLKIFLESIGALKNQLDQILDINLDPMATEGAKKLSGDLLHSYNKFLSLLDQQFSMDMQVKKGGTAKVAWDWWRNQFLVNNNKTIEAQLSPLLPDTQCQLILDTAISYIQRVANVSPYRAKQIAILTTQHGFGVSMSSAIYNLMDVLEGRMFQQDSNASVIDISYANNEVGITLCCPLFEVDLSSSLPKKKNMFNMRSTVYLKWRNNQDSMPIISDVDYQFESCNLQMDPLILQSLRQWSVLKEHKENILACVNQEIIKKIILGKSPRDQELAQEITTVRECLGLTQQIAKEYGCTTEQLLLESKLVQGYQYVSYTKIADIPQQLHSFYYEIVRIINLSKEFHGDEFFRRMAAYYQYENSVFKKNYDHFFNELYKIKVRELNQISDILYWDQLLTKINSVIEEQKKCDAESDIVSLRSESSGMGSSIGDLNDSRVIHFSPKAVLPTAVRPRAYSI